MNKSWHVILKKIRPFEFQRGITSFVNPYSMLVLEKEIALAEGIDYWHIDGISLVRVVSKTLNIEALRYSFDETSLAPIVFKNAKANNLRVAIIGTTEELISEAVRQIENLHEINISYFRNGFFQNEAQISDCISSIILANIDIVICGMGTPHQEKFLIKLKNSGWNGYGYSCGGYLHQTARNINYYPAIFDKLNIRWIYRIIDEPKLIFRYMIKYPLFFSKFRGYTLNKKT